MNHRLIGSFILFLTGAILISLWFMQAYLHVPPKLSLSLLPYKTIGRYVIKKPEEVQVVSPSYTVEIRIARSQIEADKLIETLRTAGIEAFYTPVNTNGYVSYPVRVGTFDSLAKAELHLREMEKKQIVGKVERL